MKAAEENLQLISVDRDKLRHGLAWVEDHSRSDRFSAIHGALLTLCVGSVANQRIDAPYAHVQEIVDWLDLIMDGRPNALAEELRKDVLDHNSIALQPQIDARPPLYRY